MRRGCDRGCPRLPRRLPLTTTTSTIFPSILPFLSRGVRALAARAPVRCSFSRAREQDLAIRLSTSSTPTTTVDETPSSGLQDDLMTYPACSHGRGIFKKTTFATRSLLAGHSSTLESLVNAFDSALPAHPPNLFPPDEKPSLPLEPLVSVSAPAHSPLPPDEKPSLDSQDVLVAASARSYGAGTFKKTFFATRCLLGHPLPLEPLVSVSAPAHSPLPPDEKPSLDSQDVLVAASARSYGAGTFKKTFFATRCLLGHPLPLEPLVSVSAPAHSPLPPDEKPSLDSQDVLVAASARSYGAGTFKKTFFATRCLLGHPLPLEPLVSVSAPAHSPLPPDEKPSLDSQDVLVAASARSYGAGTFKKTFFATRCLLGHPLPLEPLASVSAPAHSPLPPDEKPSLDSQDVLVAASARSYGAGTFKKTFFATRCLLGHPLPLEPLVSISASAPSPSPPVHTLLLRRSGS